MSASVAADAPVSGKEWKCASGHGADISCGHFKRDADDVCINPAKH
jgi:hypothetical protein